MTDLTPDQPLHGFIAIVDDDSDQATMPTDSCVRSECLDVNSEGRAIYPKLVWDGQFWICPNCNYSYGADAKEQTQ